MEMCKNKTLVMPRNYALMDEEEMMYVEGEGKPLKYSLIMRSKGGCLGYATVLKSKGEYDNIDLLPMAAEIYSHALGYYDFGLALTVATKAGAGGFFEKAYGSIMNGIDLENKLDKRKFKGIYYYKIFNYLYAAGPVVF